MNSKKKIVLIEDHHVIREGIKGLVERLGYEVMADYNNGKEFIDSYPFSPAPDLILLDFIMPEMDGMQVMNWMNEKKIDIPVMMLTMNTKNSDIIKLFRMGLRGFINKDCSPAELKKAIEEIFDYGFYHNDFLSQSLKAKDSDSKEPHEIIAAKLSDKEYEFLRLVCNAEEYTYEQIASIMKVHRRTVDGYRESLFNKFEIRSKTGLVLFALKNNLIGL